MSDEGDRESWSADEAFDLLANETRVAILGELVDPERETPPTYAELMDAVGVEDSGRFNYHLGKLRGQYVRKLDGGYAPTAAATAVHRAVLSTRPTEDPDREWIDGAGTCHECGGDLAGRFHNGYFNLVCRGCDETHLAYHFPEAGLDGRSDAEVLAAVDRVVRSHSELALAGVCPFCFGRTDVGWRLDADATGADADDGAPPSLWLRCTTCSYGPLLDAPTRLFVDRALLGRLADVDDGVAPGERYLWELRAVLAGEDPVEVRSTDPVRVAVEVSADGRTVTVVFDGTGAVGAVEGA